MKDYIGKEIVMGVRPEAISAETEDVAASPDTTFEALLEVVEMLGSETLLYLNIKGLSATARVNPLTQVKAGDTMKLAIDSNRIHLFDKETENIIARV